MICYKITNRVNGKSYIGVSKQTLMRRWMQHCAFAKRGIDTVFYRAMRKHGTENFSCVVLCEAATECELAAIESGLIAEHATLVPNGYNVMTGGYNSIPVRRRFGEQTGNNRINEEVIAFIRNPKFAHLSNTEVAKLVNIMFNRSDVTNYTIDKSRAGVSWRHLNQTYPPIRPGSGGRKRGGRLSSGRFI